MSDLLQRLNKIASDKGTQGKQSTLLALAALALLNKDNDIVFDPDDLPGTFARLTPIVGVPVTQKVSFTAAQIAAIQSMSPAAGDLPAVVLPAKSVVLSTTVKHSVSLIGPAAAAVGTLTSDTVNVVDGDTVTIGAKVYTFKTALTPAEGEVLIGAIPGASLTNLAHAINHTGTPGTDYQVAAAHPTVRAPSSLFPPETMTELSVTAITPGVAGNSIATTETSAHLSWGAVTLGGGSDDTLSAATAQLQTGQHNYGTAFDVFGAPGDEIYDFYAAPQSELMAAPVEVNLHVALTGANLSDIIAGAIDAWITYFVRP